MLPRRILAVASFLALALGGSAVETASPARTPPPVYRVGAISSRFGGLVPWIPCTLGSAYLACETDTGDAIPGILVPPQEFTEIGGTPGQPMTIYGVTGGMTVPTEWSTATIGGVTLPVEYVEGSSSLWAPLVGPPVLSHFAADLTFDWADGTVTLGGPMPGMTTPTPAPSP